MSCNGRLLGDLYDIEVSLCVSVRSACGRWSSAACVFRVEAQWSCVWMLALMLFPAVPMTTIDRSLLSFVNPIFSTLPVIDAALS